MSSEARKFFEQLKRSDIELPKEAVLHRMHDERNIPEGPSMESIVIRHVQGDMSPAHIVTSMQPEPTLGDKIKDIGGAFWDALAPAAALGAEEITRVLMTGNGYVFHGDTIPDEMQRGLHAEPMQKEREGRGMER